MLASNYALCLSAKKLLWDELRELTVLALDAGEDEEGD